MKTPFFSRHLHNTLNCLSVLGISSVLLAGCTTTRQLSTDQSLFVTAGGPQNCIYSAQQVACWGWNFYGGTGVTEGPSESSPRLWEQEFTNISSLSLGTNHGCLVDGGAVKCWGWNQYGQVDGHPSSLVRSPIKSVQLPEVALGVSSQGSHSCAWTDKNSIYCWGKNFYGQLASKDKQEKGPVKIHGIPSTFKIERVEAHYHHSCALSNNQLWCWGWNEMGQVGAKKRSMSVQRVRLPEGKIENFALGAFHTCASVGKKLLCWGRNDLGQIGLADRKNYFVPTTVVENKSISSLHAGYKHTCYTHNEDLYCTGWNLAGQLGYATDSDHSSAFKKVDFHLPENARVFAGYAHNCYQDGNRFYCWGTNRFGQLGVRDMNMSMRPLEVSTSHLKFK